MIREGPGGSVARPAPVRARGHRCGLGERVRAVVRSGQDRDRLASEREAGAAHQQPMQPHRSAKGHPRPRGEPRRGRLQLWRGRFVWRLVVLRDRRVLAVRVRQRQRDAPRRSRRRKSLPAASGAGEERGAKPERPTSDASLRPDVPGLPDAAHPDRVRLRAGEPRHVLEPGRSASRSWASARGLPRRPRGPGPAASASEWLRRSCRRCRRIEC